MAEKSSLEVSNTTLTRRRFVQVELEVLHVLPFDSVRKRMSVLVRDPASGERKLFCKGADSNMLPRLARPQTQVSPSSLCLVRETDASTAMALVATCCRVSRVPNLRSVRRLCVCVVRENDASTAMALVAGQQHVSASRASPNSGQSVVVFVFISRE